MKNHYKIKTQDEQCEELIALALDLFSPAPKVLSKSEDILARLMAEKLPAKKPRYVPEPNLNGLVKL